MSSDPPYVPISCSVHDRLLALATLRQESEIEIDDGADASTIRGLIADVYSRDGAEYLQLQDGPTVRLDRIRSLDGERVLQPGASTSTQDDQT